MNKHAISWAVAALVLSACGGGGDGDGGGDSIDLGPPVSLSANNYDAAAAEVIGSVAVLFDSGSVLQDVLTGVEVKSSPGLVQLLRQHLPLVSQALASQPAHLTGVTVSDTVPCSDDGNMSVRWEDRNNNDELDAGDQAAITMQSCVMYGVTLNGSFVLDVNSYVGYIGDSSYSLDTRIDYQNFSIAYDGIQQTVDGVINLRMGAQSYSTSSLDMLSNATVQRNGGGRTETYKMVNYRLQADYDGWEETIRINGGIYVPHLGSNMATVSTVSPIVFSDGNYPESGQLRIVANGGVVRLNANGSSMALIEFDADSNGIYVTSKSVPWDEMF